MDKDRQESLQETVEKSLAKEGFMSEYNQGQGIGPMEVDDVYDILTQIWAGQFKLEHNPNRLCPICLVDRDLVYMIWYRSQGGKYICPACGFTPMKQEGLD